MKKSIVFYFSFLFVMNLFSQSNIRLNNIWENTYTINPAYINSEYKNNIALGARKQWLMFPGSPTSIFLNGTTYLEKSHIQLGMKAMNDRIGYTSTSQLDLSYSYALRFNKEAQLNFGLSANFRNFSYDLESMMLPTIDLDPTAARKMTNVYSYNADLGVEFVTSNLRVGASSQNLFSLFRTNDFQQQTNINYIYGFYKQNTINFVDLGLGICATQYKNMFQSEIYVTSFFKSNLQTDLFQAGVFYRPKDEMGVILGVNLSDRIRLTYSYDFNVGGISRRSIGSHELLIIYHFDRLPIFD